MLQTCRILVRVITLAGLAAIAGTGLLVLGGCGQPGALYLPTEAAAARRATLPQTLLPGMRDSDSAKPAAPAASAPTSAPAIEPATVPADK